MDAHITCHDGQLLPMSAAIWFGALLTGCNGMADVAVQWKRDSDSHLKNDE